MLTLMTVVVAGSALGALLAWLRRGWVLVTVEGPSMLPTLDPGDRILVRRTDPSRIRVGQVVVVERPDTGGWVTPPLTGWAVPPAGHRWIVKRAVAGPGDPVPADVPDAGHTAVPPGCFVLLGDNRNESFDSRIFGFVPGSRILGPVRLSGRS